MNKKTILIAGIVWGLVFVSGITYYQMKKSSEKINIIEIPKKESIVSEDIKQENINFYLVSEENNLKVQEGSIPLYPHMRDKIRKITEICFENLWKSKVLKTEQVEIINIYIKGDMVYLDVDANILELKSENRRNLLAIYSIVNSITEIGNIRKVKILVDGKEETGSFSKTYTRNTNI